MSAFEGAGKAFEGMMEKLATGKVINTTNEPIDKIGNSLLGGGEMIARMLNNKGSVKEAFDATFRGAVADGAEEGTKGALNYGKIAGSYIGVSSAYRVLSGGGVYKDKNGNTNLIGVPFI